MHLKTLILTLGFIVGIFIGDKLNIATEVAIFSLVVACVHSCITFFFVKKECDTTVSIITVLIFLGLFFGIARVQLMSEKNSFVCDKKCVINAEVVATPTRSDNSQQLEVFLYKDNNYADVAVKTSLYPTFKAGDRLTIEGVIEKPQIILPIEPNKKSFDYESYLKTQGIGSEMYFPKINKEEVSSDKFVYKLINLKDDWVARVNNYVSSDVSPLANGMLFGNADFSKEMKDTFRIAGLSHIVVLSGFNIAVVVAFVMLVLRFVPLILRIVLAFSSVIFFVLMVGGEASAVRAVIMAAISLLALASGKEYVARQALILSLLVMSAHDPNLILNNVSFHLSFLATAGIVYLSPVLDEVFEKLKANKFVKSIFVTTISATIATLPYIIYTFGYISTYAIITNAIVVPFVPIAMLLSALVVVGSYVGVIVTDFLGVVTTIFLKFIIGVARIFSGLPFSYVPFSLSIMGMFLIYALIIILYFVTKNYVERKINIDDITGEEFEVIKY